MTDFYATFVTYNKEYFHIYIVNTANMHWNVKTDINQEFINILLCFAYETIVCYVFAKEIKMIKLNFESTRKLITVS